MAKTSVRLQYAANLWPLVEEWAGEHKYILRSSKESTRLFIQEQKETNAKIRVEISQVADAVQIYAWFSDLIRKELALDSASLYASLPRKEAFSEIQKLISMLGNTPVRKAKTAKKNRNIAFNLGRSIRKMSGKK